MSLLSPRMRRFFLMLGIGAILIPSTSRAQWNAHDSVVVSTDLSDIELAMIGDGAGGSFMAWSQWIPNVGWRILAQRSDSAGQLLWSSGGIQVSDASGYEPELILDGAGGVLVIWRDWGIRAMRLDAIGSPVWPAIVEIVSNDEYPSLWSSYASDGAGGAVVTWYGNAGFNNDTSLYDIRAQRISASGELPWGAEPVVVCGAGGEQSDPRVVVDDQGGAIFAWRDERTSENADIFAQRVDVNGSLLWASEGVPVCVASGVQGDVALHADGSGGAIVLWEDGRQPDAAIYGQHLDALGQTEWITDGVRIGGVDASSVAFRSVTDLAGGAIVTWAGGYTSATPRTAQRIDGDGNLLWAPDGVVIVDEDEDTTVAHVAPDGSGGAFFAWMDRRRENCEDTYAQHLDATGSHLWEASGVVVAAIDRSRAPHGVAPYSESEALVFWGTTGPTVGLPKQLDERFDPPQPLAETSSTGTVLSRVGSGGTGWIADCENPTATPPVVVELSVSNHPNPFNPRTVIEYVTPIAGHVRLVVYDAAGRAVRRLVDRRETSGTHEVVWDGRDDRGDRVRSGAYLSRLAVGDHTTTHPMLLLK